MLLFSFLFVYVVMTMYIAASVIETVAVAVLPLWLSTDISHGGMGYSVPNLALVLSAGCIISFILHSIFKSRMAYVLKSSPVRTLRYIMLIFKIYMSDCLIA